MTDGSTQHDNSPEVQVPQAFVDDLAEAFAARVFVPPAVDEAILAVARRRLVRRRRLLWWPAAGAVAAAIALAFWLGQQAGPVASGPSVPAVVAAHKDIDGSGRVDILDAFALARKIEAGHGTDSNWDVNGDGVVDQEDVDAIAAAAVSVSGGSV